jgi:hypothetical protein
MPFAVNGVTDFSKKRPERETILPIFQQFMAKAVNDNKYKVAVLVITLYY